MPTATMEKVVLTPKPIQWHQFTGLVAAFSHLEGAVKQISDAVSVGDVEALPASAPPDLSPADQAVRTRLERAIRELEAQPDLHAFFRAARVRGIPGHSGNCVVALWLQKAVGTFIGVGHGGAFAPPGPHRTQELNVRYSGRHLSRFIEAFDKGAYPDLVLRPRCGPGFVAW